MKAFKAHVGLGQEANAPYLRIVMGPDPHGMVKFLFIAYKRDEYFFDGGVDELYTGCLLQDIFQKLYNEPADKEARAYNADECRKYDQQDEGKAGYFFR